MEKQYVELPEAVAVWGKDTFADIFLGELEGQSQSLPLERMCSHGGWPDEETLELSIKSVTESDGNVTVAVDCYFTELVATGCADIDRSEDGHGTVEIVIDLRDRRAYILRDSDDLW